MVNDNEALSFYFYFFYELKDGADGVVGGAIH